LAGTTVLLFYDRLPYIGYVIANLLRGRRWRPDRQKTVVSLGANLIVWGFLILVLRSAGLPALLTHTLPTHPQETILGAAGLVGLVLLGYRFRIRLNRWSHWLLRLPLRSGLFANFERSRYLRQRLSLDRLQASPIRVIIAATDLERGRARFFSNSSREALESDPGADPAFVAAEIEPAEDLLRVIVASSALPIAYEPLQVRNTLCSDGGVVSNQPIRPAVRLGADVLFLVLVRPLEEGAGEVKTFVDVGLRALEILMMQNLIADLKDLRRMNKFCENHAAELGVRPEEVVVDTGTRTYRYVKAFTIQPKKPLGATLLDFGGPMTRALILEGYRDATAVVAEFLSYAAQQPNRLPRYRLRFRAESLES
jgi:predicted acylesterase/phospholipase RssA